MNHQHTVILQRTIQLAKLDQTARMAVMYPKTKNYSLSQQYHSALQPVRLGS